MPKWNPKSFVAKFFGHEQASVKTTHNPSSVSDRGPRPRVDPRMVFGFSYPRSKSTNNWRKALIFVNKNLPTTISGTKRVRKNFEVEYTKVHELAHVYAQRAGKVADQMHEIFADLVALEYFAQTKPQISKTLVRMAKSKSISLRMRANIDSHALKIHTLFPQKAREEIINDFIIGRVEQTGRVFSRYLSMKAEKYGLSEEEMFNSFH